MMMSSDISQPPDDATVCDTTPVRYFAFVDRLDILAHVCGGVIRLPRQVWNPDESLDLPDQLMSEVGIAIRSHNRRSGDPDALMRAARLMTLRLRKDIEIVDLSDEEHLVYAHLIHRRQKPTPLGRGEAAVIAVAEGRGLAAGLDDGPARRLLAHRSPEVGIRAIRDFLRHAAATGYITSQEAQDLNDEMRMKGYKGPAFIWQ